MDARTHTYIGYGRSNGHIYLPADARLAHLAVLGASGVGKSIFLESLAAQDIARGDGVMLLDPHGPLAEAVLRHVPPSRHNEVCVLDLADLSYPVGINFLEDVEPDRRAVVVDGVIASMRAIWHESWGPRMELILRHAARALIEVPNASIAMIPKLLVDDAYRRRVAQRVSDPYARAFFSDRFETFRETHRAEIVDPILNKLEALLSFPHIRNVIGAGRSTLHLEQAMTRGRIVIVCLARTRISETASNLTGALLIGSVLSKLTMAQKRHFHLIIDEAHSFSSTAVASLVKEARKFGVSVTFATQDLASLDVRTRAALLGAVHSLMCFRLGVEDADLLAPSFDQQFQSFNPYALQHFATGEAVIRIGGNDGVVVDVARPREGEGNVAAIKQQSRLHYGNRREDVERKLLRALA
ncbi:type IV secretory system conjugative DNA transfer family protein [Hyphomicrobium sp.]|uniref:type IV secretory system conjugative DNA transfer family protein n=1 Tax=Hyphomicrobium sp. TaxID=82 RepID=UPI002E354889|nr:type IV secretion system DNA-binding domain-containing protein [Hyphomicrobium sp.]HEX2841383.1 type IV secretion system DNA-binding domain-containing protein [Hyphomicrobium sp.]